MNQKPRQLQSISGVFIRCRWCTAPAVALFVHRTDGRNGFVCEDHFVEGNVVLCDPRWNTAVSPGFYQRKGS